MGKEIKVYTKGINSKITKDELRFAAKFMYWLLVSPKIHNATILYIESAIIPKKEEAEAFVEVKDIESQYPRRFRIRINPIKSKRSQLFALAHELVHVKQYAKREMGFTYTKDGVSYTRWKRRVINENKVNYFDCDWEIEAYGRELGLYKRYRNFVKEHKLVFRPDAKRS